MGHVHRHAEIRSQAVGGGDGSGAVGLLLGAAQEIQVHVQLCVLQLLRRVQQDGKADSRALRPAQELVPQVAAAGAVDGWGAHGDAALGLLLGETHVEKQVFDGDCLIHILPALDVGGQTGHHPIGGGIGENGQLPVGEHPGVHPPPRGAKRRKPS